MNLKNWTFAKKVCAMVLGTIVCLSAAVSALLGFELYRYADRLGVERQSENILVALDVLHSYGSELRVDGGKLYAGSQELNGFYEPVDRIKGLLGGAATVFMGDERISTNVKKRDGSRAVGTRLAPGKAYDSIFKQGLAFHGEADILGDAYFTAYEPLRDAGGTVIGALFVGTPKAQFYSGMNGLVRQCILATLVLAGVALTVCLVIARRMFEPLGSLRASAERLSRGDTSVDIGFIDRHDDLGQLAAALSTVRQAGIDKQRLEAEAQHQRDEADRQRIKIEHDRADVERLRLLSEENRAREVKEQAHVVQSISLGLEKLASGDLTFRLKEPFYADYEKLRADFNDAMVKVLEVMKTVVMGVHGLRTGGVEINQASIDLARRTEQQAASLEETSSALHEITVSVGATADGVLHARGIVKSAKAGAEQSGQIVREAVDTMTQIESSSQQISHIVEVIDEIAFQTNLLALNAAVEAARAGDQGRGFAVVASEVRGLAQRSASAAKEIKALISLSTEQVACGVKRVAATGDALARIDAEVTQINIVVAEIADAASEQAKSLGEVNTAVVQMDQGTQENAAMVEQMTAAAHSLSNETDALAALVGRFRIDEGIAVSTAQRPGQRVARVG